MFKNILKSIGAVVAGFVVAVVLSYSVDAILMATGVMPDGILPKYGAEVLVASVLIYRILFNTLGSFVAAKLAPSHPMRHALALGVLGLLGGTAAALSNQEIVNAAPAWYSWGIAISALPTAWLGGKLSTLKLKKS